MGKKRWLAPEEYLGLRVAIASSFFGFFIAGVLVLNHYAYADAAFCGVGEWASCNEVNRSEWSEIAGIPVSLLGLLGFAALAGLATLRLSCGRSHLGESARPLLALAAAGGLAFGAYLTLVELFLLHLVCLLCLASLLLFILAVFAMRRSFVAPWKALAPRAAPPSAEGS